MLIPQPLHQQIQRQVYCIQWILQPIYTTQCSNIKTFYLEFLRGPVDQERIITVGESCVGVEDGTRWVEWWAKYTEGWIRTCVTALKI